VVARTDRARHPEVVADLAAARLGEAAFRRALVRLDDSALDAPTFLPGWSRRHLVAHVGYNARALSRLVTWADTGVEHPMYATPDARLAEIDLGATLRPHALRSLAEHSAVELDVRWRDLPDDRWHAEVRTAQGRRVPVAETLWMRQREVWLHAVDLDAGLRVRDLPEQFLARLLDDVTTLWQRRGDLVGVRLERHDGAGTWQSGSPDVVACGTLAQLVQWATGRGDTGLRWSGGAARPAPRWL